MGDQKFDKNGHVIDEPSMEQVFCGNELSYGSPEKTEMNSIHLSYAEARQMSASK